MPRPDQERITARQQPKLDNTPVAFQRAARPVDQTVAAGRDAELDGLFEGLKGINPKIERYLQQENTINAQAAVADGENAGRLELDPNKNLSNPLTYPEGLPTALRPNFEAGYKRSIGISLGNKSKEALIDGYMRESKVEGFNPEKFLQEFTAKEYAGITDPAILGEMSRIHADTVQKIRTADGERRRTEFFTQGKERQLAGLQADLTPDMDPGTLGTRFIDSVRPAMEASGMFTKTEVNNAMLDHLQAMSMRGGGRPELFDALLVQDTDGMSPYNSNPKFAEAVEKARSQATTQRDSKLSQEDMVANAKILTGFTDDLRNERFGNITDERISAHIGKRRAFPTTAAAAAFMEKRNKALDEAREVRVTREAVHNGAGALADRKLVEKVLDKDLKVPIETLKTRPADSPESQAAIGTIIDYYSRHGLSGIAAKPLQSFVSGLATEVPSKDAEPSPRFLASLQLFEQLKGRAANLIDTYFDEDSKDILEAYSGQRNAQVEPKLALQNAYNGQRPEDKKRVADLMKMEGTRLKLRKTVHDAVVGWATRWFPGAKIFGWEPSGTETTSVGYAAQVEGERYLRSNPSRTVEQAQEHLAGWAAKNFVHDKYTNTIIQVPPNEGGEAGAEAIARYTKFATEAGVAAGAFGADATVSMTYMGLDENRKHYYQVRTEEDRLGTVTFDEIKQQAFYAKNLTDQERTDLGAIVAKVKDGTLTKNELDASGDLIAKGRIAGAWRDEHEAKTRRIRGASLNRTSRVREFMDRLDAIEGAEVVQPKGSPAPVAPAVTAPAGTTPVAPKVAPISRWDGLDTSSMPPNRVKTVVAKAFLAEGDPFGALTSMGEGVALKAYNDPATGRNIGMGYNMTKNAKNLEADFRAAGIPAEHFAAVRDGRREITVDQAVRLYKHTKPRYVEQARKAVEAKHPGEWAALPPNYQAVLADIAYQTGNARGFPKAIEAMISGDVRAVKEETKVYYVNRAGERVFDQGRHNLRMHMLTSSGVFGNAVDHVSSIPRNILEARQVNN